MSDPSVSASFVRVLHRALVCLYNPAALRKSPLIELFSLDPQRNPVAALQRILAESIEALKPAADVPPQAPAWRAYRILFHRYAEQCTQVEVASILALSERQLRREEHQAIHLLAEYLWSRYGVQLKEAALSKLDELTTQVPEPLEAGTPSREQELEWLRKSSAGEMADIAEETKYAMNIVSALLESAQVQPQLAIPEGMPHVAVQPTVLRQALINVLAVAIRAAPRGQVRIAVKERERKIEILIEPVKGAAPPPVPSPDDVESLEMSRQLIALSDGTLVLSQEAERPFTATLILPVAEQAVLVIDDNVDTLRLFQRCLAGTRYPFIGARDPEQALTLVGELRPRIIVLDLMLPGVDGWEVLGRLREHPRTRDIPIVVCSILPQEQLALSLGAAAFLRKPVSRATLLTVLDQLVIS